MLSVREVSHAYGRRTALEEVGFDVPAGAFAVLLGPNGAGKSTLYALLTRLLPLQTGRIEVAGHGIGAAPLAALARMGVVFQSPTLDLDLSVQQNLAYFARLRGLPARTARVRIDAELERLGLAERRTEKVRQLNGGHRRRLEIARALLHEPDVLLLDEPTVGLDIPTRRRIVDDVHALAADKGVTVLWATHLIDEVRAGDRVIVLHEGRVRASGEIMALLDEHDADDISALFDDLTGLERQAPMRGVSRREAAP
ncbi:MAG: ABC transporter ATP-binding protein [Rhizobiales bacterium NRL2]|jgi:ABC-2 type transport system ATP-binding protein|nr:MAG: ABC transporter ATP-binding protein [Rhizobiales bacterium NRL2]